MIKLEVTQDQLEVLEEILGDEIKRQKALIDRDMVDQYTDLFNVTDKKKHFVGKHIETGKVYRKTTLILTKLWSKELKNE